MTGQSFWLGTYNPLTEKFNVTDDRLYGNFDISLDNCSRMAQLHATPHTPRDVLHLSAHGCRMLVRAIRCHAQFRHWLDIGGGGGGFSGGAAHWAATSNSFATRCP